MQTIRECVPDSVKIKSKLNYRCMIFVSVIAWAALVFVVGTIKLGLSSSLIGVVVLTLPGTILGIQQYLAYKKQLERFPPPVVEFHDGMITAYNAETSITAAVADCRLSNGLASTSSFLGSRRLFYFATVILIRLPADGKWWRRQPVVAVGLTESSRKEWEALLHSR